MRLSNAARYRDGAAERQVWLTPLHVLELVAVDLGGSIDLDPCTEPDNPTGAATFYTVADDGLVQPWAGSVFCNPPYGRARADWLARCVAHGEHSPTTALIPADTETAIFQTAARTTAAIVFLSRRLQFDPPLRRPNGSLFAAPFGSALLGWRVTLDACSILGLRVTP